MEAHPRNLTRIFHADLRLIVPLFQRPYVWQADEQWLPLWEDVLATRDRVADGGIMPHFLGAVVLEAKNTAHGGLEVREVIDGQQRLTTLQLLIAAVRDSFQARGFGDDRTAKRLNKLVRNDLDLVELADEEFRFWPTNADRVAYRAVMTGQHTTTRYTDKIKGIVGAYTWFMAEIRAHLSAISGAAVVPELTGIAEALLEYLEVVVIDLGKDDNAQIIFETLNARGTPLRASDLIKNLIFRTLQDAERPIEGLYEAYWAPLEAEKWQTEIRQGRLNRARLDAFMGYFLTILLQREVQAHQLFPAVRAHIDRDPDRAEALLRELARYSEVYTELEALNSDIADEAAMLDRMQIVDTTTMTPLLLWLFANTAGVERYRAIAALESYVVRRSLARLTTKNYNRLFLELLRRLGVGAGPAGQVVETYLTEQASDSGMWPTDQEIATSFATLPLYRLLKRERLQRVLLALELHARSNKTESIRTNQKLSVEHLLPQNWDEHWPLSRDIEEAERERTTRLELLHTVGNLTLVTGSLNSALSNSSWVLKRRHLLEHSALTLNRRLPESWSTSAIRVRASQLADLAVDLWKRPAPLGALPLYASPLDRDLRPDRDRSDTAVESPSTAGRSVTGRRDIGKHVEYVYADLPAGQFLTVSEIVRRPSPEYSGKPPSAGAISARLFPSTGRTTLQGVVPDVQGGIRGARKI